MKKIFYLFIINYMASKFLKGSKIHPCVHINHTIFAIILQSIDGYKHKYCEACRNQQVHTLKKGLKAAAGVTGTVACLVVTVMTAGEIDLKKIK